MVTVAEELQPSAFRTVAVSVTRNDFVAVNETDFVPWPPVIVPPEMAHV